MKKLASVLVTVAFCVVNAGPILAGTTGGNTPIQQDCDALVRLWRADPAHNPLPIHCQTTDGQDPIPDVTTAGAVRAPSVERLFETKLQSWLSTIVKILRTIDHAQATPQD